MTKKITLELSHDQALVLFECLANLDETRSVLVVDDAEQKVFWRLEGLLESQLTEIVDPNYKELLKEAKARLMKDEG